ncbi:PstS family phosphate ABC transporter substrate-binding protein [Salisaeta longa]|uniref:PstS family phosphate ABC transporter substrate-binding protein n=1 Tax=Salisaeta longa TaxID=503170 RepID=UPI000A04A622|nr:PstS family phosphate ABC transporter substrate-binding protein [Salisaeta longa]
MHLSVFTRWAFVAAALLLLVGCGSDSSQRTVRVDGSSTVYPLSEAVAESYMTDNPKARVLVGVSGTGGGFSKFVRGSTDINNASRPITQVEDSLAQQNNISYIELPVAYDGLSLVVHPKNDWVECLTVAELRKIWKPNSTVEQWSDIRPSFPDRPINLYGAGTDSGTYDYFTAAIVGEEGASRTDFTASEDDNVLVQGVNGDPNALGFMGLAYYEENKDKLKLLGVDDNNPNNGQGCIKPSFQTVNNGTYQPLARPEFIYVRGEAAQSEAVQNFVNYYLTHADTLAKQVGYVPLSRDAYQMAQQRFKQRVTGTMFADGSAVGVQMEALLRQATQPTATDTTATQPDTTATQPDTTAAQ